MTGHRGRGRPYDRRPDPRSRADRGHVRGPRPAAPTRGRVRRGGKDTDALRGGFTRRATLLNVGMLMLLGVVIAQLVLVQVIRSPQLRAESAGQRTVVTEELAVRGDILDVDGQPMAYTRSARSLTFQPKVVRAQLEAAHAQSDSEPTVEEYLEGAAEMIDDLVGEQAPRKKTLELMEGDGDFVYLARRVDPAVAAQITEEYPLIGTDPDDVREYPGGALAANIIGSLRADGDPALGLEQSMDSLLGGTSGTRTYDRGSAGEVIPGSKRDVQPAVDGSDVRLTIDSDIQYFLQQSVQQAKDVSGADNVSGVVLDVETGHVLGMANDGTFDPARGLGDKANQNASLSNIAVSSPFEPGSVNKIITAAAVIEDGVTDPDEVLQVPGAITVDGATVSDAWEHGVAPYTTTGIFGKSSNVGTLMLADRVGPERYAEMLELFGLGHRTGVELPGESGGLVPPLDQWSGGTFANLPIGQGLSITLLQMAGLFQTIGNDGERIPPRIVAEIVDADGEVTRPEAAEPVRVVSAETAATVREMFRAVVQSDPGDQQGTGPAAAVDGYQISGKTGTAQQVDPACGCYSNSDYWITFAGLAPADDPRYVIALMMDRPERASDGSGAPNAAPLFHEIAAWLLQRDQVPLSPPAPHLLLQAG